MVTTKLNLSMTEPSVRQIYAKQGDTGRVLDITLDQTPEDGTLRILRPDGTEATSEAVTGGEISESGETVTFESMTEADVTELKANIEPIQLSLPSGYQAIEYIQSTGHEYINTGFVPTSDDGFEIDFISNNDLIASGNYGCIFGARASSNTLDFQLTSWSAAGTVGTLRWGTNLTHDGGLLDKGTRQKASLLQKTYTAPSGSTWSFTGSYTSAYPIYVFSLNQAGSPTQNGSVILYSLKLYRGADLAMYLIPCKRTSDNKLGLYDVVGGTFLPVVNIDSSANPQGGGNVTLPNPTNPLSITGHDEVRVTRTGKNLLDGTDFADEQTVAGLTITKVSGTHYKINGTSSSTTWLPFSGSNDIPLSLPTGTYTLSAGNDKVYCYLYRETNFADAVSAIQKVTSENKPITGCRFLVSANKTFNNEDVYLQIELGSTATSYEPYQSNTYTTSLGQTVYGGTLDLVTGVLTVDKAMVDLGTLNWGYRAADSSKPYPQEYATLPGAVSGISTNVVCSIYSASQEPVLGRTVDKTICTFNGAVYVSDSSYSTATEFKTAMSGVYLVYELATPQTYTLTAQQIKTLVGANNVWASSGDIISIKFAYGGLLSELPSEATEIVGKCYCDVEQNGVSSMPFTLNVKKNERES